MHMSINGCKDSVYLCILSEFGELIEKVLGVLTYQLEEVTTQHPPV